MIPYEEWEVVYDDPEIDGRRDPQEQEGYGINIKHSNQYILFPRGTLKEVARSNRIHGQTMIKNLLGNTNTIEEVLKGTRLIPDSVIAVACKMHISEEERYQSWIANKS